VAIAISRSLYQQRVDSKAEHILLEARSIAEANLTGMETDEDIKKLAGNYGKTAAELAEKYKLKVYAGKTGLLSAADMQSDKILGMLYIEGEGFANVGLIRVVFAVEPLKASELGPIDIHPPRLYENIGPLKDVREATQGYAGKSMLLGRVIQAEKAAVPENIDQKIDRRTVIFDNEDDGDVNTIKQFVVEDLKRLAARDIADIMAREFVQLADKDGWEAAIEKFNELYHKGVKGAEGDANTISHFALQKRTGIRRISERDFAAIEIRYEGDPMARELLFRNNVERLLIDELYSLVPPDANTLPKPGVVVDFKPTLSYYCLKSITVHRLNKDQSDKILEEFQDAQVLAVVHYNPENIAKRMNFSIIKEQKGSDKPESSP
jgi:hypothetical protein